MSILDDSFGVQALVVESWSLEWTRVKGGMSKPRGALCQQLGVGEGKTRCSKECLFNSGESVNIVIVIEYKRPGNARENEWEWWP